MELPNPYHGNYRLLMAIPIVLVLASLAVLLFVSPVRQGIDFKGGVEITVLSPQVADVSALTARMKEAGYALNKPIESKPNPTGYVTQVELERPEALQAADALKIDFYTLSPDAERAEVSAVYSNDSKVIADYAAKRAGLDPVADKMFALAGSPKRAAQYNTTSALSKDVLRAYSDLSSKENDRLRGIISSSIPSSSASFNEVTSSLSAKFLDKAVTVVLYSILLTSVVVFLIFRDFTPSIAVLAGAAADVTIALGAMGLLGIPLTLASFAALLMLVGFSLDTDVLLTMRVMKMREGTAAQRAYDAMKTGMTMSVSSLVAFSALMALALVTHIPIYYEIAAVALAGLFGDLAATWCFNAVIVLHHAEELEKKGGVPVQRSLLSYIFKN